MCLNIFFHPILKTRGSEMLIYRGIISRIIEGHPFYIIMIFVSSLTTYVDVLLLAIPRLYIFTIMTAASTRPYSEFARKRDINERL